MFRNTRPAGADFVLFQLHMCWLGSNRKLRGIEPNQDDQIYTETLNAKFLFGRGAAPAEYGEIRGRQGLWKHVSGAHFRLLAVPIDC